jgi:murein DD-endopeptidase MepM/ murein hydrolase activator NlpD
VKNVLVFLLVSGIALFSLHSQMPAPTAPWSLKNECARDYQAGNHQRTVNTCLRVLNTYPNDELVLLYLAWSYDKLEMYDDAENQYLKVLRQNNYNHHAKSGLGSLYYRMMNQSLEQDNVNLAFDYIKKAEYYLPDDTRFFVKDAELNEASERFLDAANAWWQSWKRASGTESAKLSSSLWKLNRMGSCFKKSNSGGKEWKNILQTLLRRHPDSMDLLLMVADAWFFYGEERVKRNQYRNRAMEFYKAANPWRKEIPLQFPLRNEWMVISGAFEPLLDTHNGINGYSYDFIKVNKDGTRSVSGDGSNPRDFPSYDEPIYAVYDGVVDLVSNTAADSGIGHLQFNATNLVQIKHVIGGRVYYSLYVHLKKGTIPLKPGQVVKAGDFIGRVGNSGMSSSPHLHFELLDTNMVSVPVRFISVTHNSENGPVHYTGSNSVSPVKYMILKK